jgi:chitinase
VRCKSSSTFRGLFPNHLIIPGGSAPSPLKLQTRYLSNISIDTDKRFDGDSSTETGTNLYGCLKQFYLLKKKNRHLKVLLSVGGANYSSNFAQPASTVQGRSTFASSAVSLIKNLGLDGLDIDWEFPADDNEAGNMVRLLQSVREALDACGNSLNPQYRFQLTVACPAGPSNYKTMHLAAMREYVDFWNLMAWDYAGSWSTLAANQANLFPSASNPGATPFDTQTAIGYYLSQGIDSNKLVLGMPVYGRSFCATDGLGKLFNGTGNGTWEAGVYDFKDLPLRGAVEDYEEATGSSYSYDAAKRELVSYDTIRVAKQKAAWIQQMKLGGIMWWESSADGEGDKSLIQNAVDFLGGEDGSRLETTPNELVYLDSAYDNLRAGMPDPEQPPQSSAITVTDDTSLKQSSMLASLSSAATVEASPSSAATAKASVEPSSKAVGPPWCIPFLRFQCGSIF